LGTLGFSSEQSTRFRYRFLGEDRDAWKEAAQAELIFPALRPGLYQLEVVAVSREGGMSDSPARVDFEILAPWYRRAWFLALALQTAILSVWLAWRWRIRRSRAQQAALAEEVLARTRELRAEKQRVQEQHQEIEQLLAEAIEAGRLRMEFLANTSHEIRTPMHAILCTLALLQDTRLEGEQCEYIDTARTAAKGLLALLDDVLDCTKLEAGRLELAAVEFSPRRVVEETAALLAGRAQEKGLALEVDLPPGSGALVSGDDGRLRQVLLNLLGNAIKFTTEGRVRIELRERAEGERVRLDFAVSDTGIGIAAEKLEVIFDPFRQADGSVTRNFGGTGLGLAISSQLVAAMGGRIEVASVPGKGSRFWFSIALAGAAGRRPAETGPAPGAGLAALDRALDVLVVEDNVVNRRLAERVLDRRGHRVVTAADGQAALELLRCRRVDVVLMDVQMPQMGGLEATRRIRSGEAGPLAGLPIIGFTASATMEDREECFSAGMDDYISKPIEPEALIAAIERYAAPDA
jgi:signal transduction histidine kinase/ActR/RegA family two-component response regulator